jgi:hypothetical protein
MSGESRLDGVMTGIRQLRRTRPLEIETVAGLRVPTLAEMARIKAWLLATRRELYHLAATDDFLRRRVLEIVRRVPLPYPRFWLAALASLGEAIDWTAKPPEDPGIA